MEQKSLDIEDLEKLYAQKIKHSQQLQDDPRCRSFRKIVYEK
jgi:hypothetical protein